ncbi:MAG TPA: hypothetical protein VM223_05130 [Planctomycetota bacterium]|nr:hypothetical protein [Planctomycetota bacterium]
MNGNSSPLGAVPILGAQQAQALAVSQQLFLGMYVPLIPQLTVYRASHGYEAEGGLTEKATPERVAEEAYHYVDAAMRRLGFAKAG